MELMDKLRGGRESRSVDDYAELEADEADAGPADASMQVHIAEIAEKQDALAIKDAVYDGDVVVADVTRLRTEDATMEHVIDDLRRVADEVGGDIVKKGDDQLLITPTGVRISREKLGTQ